VARLVVDNPFPPHGTGSVFSCSTGSVEVHDCALCGLSERLVR
jgi:hypothetical protein